MTDKLFERDGYLLDFTAVVTASEKRDDGYYTEFDRTAFFPGGGGQGADEGTVNGSPISGMKLEGDRIFHILRDEIPVGTSIEGHVDPDVRIPRMQCHSGEHLVSGLIHNIFGYENVGFHLNDSFASVDTSGKLSDEDMDMIQRLANRAVMDNIKFNISFPSDEEIKNIEYRSKKELTGQIRIVEIPGIDCCACCAPHVYTTGNIGFITIISHQAYKGGTRMFIIAGSRAVEDNLIRKKALLDSAVQLSVKQEELPEAVERLKNQLQESRLECAQLKKRLAEYLFNDAVVKNGVRVLYSDMLDADTAKEFAQRDIVDLRLSAVFFGSDGSYRYVMASETVNLRQNSKAINALINGKGGGLPELISGASSADRASIDSVIFDIDPV